MSDVLGGAELHLLHTAEACARRVGVRVAGAPGSPLLRAAAEHGIETVGIDVGAKLGRRTALANARRLPAARRRVHALVRESGWTVMQFKWEEVLWGGEVAADRVALWEHGPIPGPLLRVPVARHRLRRAFSSAAAVLAWSDPAAEAIETLSGRVPERLHAGVDPERVAAAVAAREATRAALEAPSGVVAGRDGAAPDKLVVFAGRLARDKGVGELLSALPLLPGVRAVICGEGPDRARLEALARTLDVEERATFAGFVDDPLPVVAAADAAVLLSTSPGEGRPLAVVEAAAVGTPTIGLAGTPALDALAREGLARLATASDPKSVAAALRAVTREPRQPRRAPTWDDTAGELLDALDR